MDSLTQITLGAAVGEAVLGKKVGNKAPLWGAVAGIIPDLDVAVAAFMEPVQRLVFHRGLSHSILFAIAFAPLLGWIISKIHRDEGVGWKPWAHLSFWGLFTHALLDSFTTYGTQLFYPFSNYPVAFNTIFVVDPLYTVPFLACVIAALFLNRASPRRRLVNYLGIALSTAYLGLTVVNKLHVDSVIRASLERQQIRYDSFMTAPMPFNNILWRAVVISGDRALSGYYSLLDSDKTVTFQAMDRNTGLIEPLRNDWEISELMRVSKGYFAVMRDEGGLIFNDLRFGQFGFEDSTGENYVFAFNIQPNGSGVEVRRVSPEVRISRELLRRLAERVLGN